MKIAILIQCHKNPKQINLLLERLNHPDIDCYLHIDKKADFANKITKRSNIVLLPDESFFQTLVMMSPYADKKTDYLTYLHFSEGANSPDILRASDFPQAKESGCLVMRKVDMDVDDFFVSR